MHQRALDEAGGAPLNTSSGIVGQLSNWLMHKSSEMVLAAAPPEVHDWSLGKVAKMELAPRSSAQSTLYWLGVWGTWFLALEIRQEGDRRRFLWMPLYRWGPDLVTTRRVQ